MTTVQLDVFSGRPNPRWTLSKAQTSQLIERIKADPSILLPVDANTGNLGYRGFIIEQSAGAAGANAWSAAGLPERARIGGRASSDQSTSRWLLGTSEGSSADIPDEAATHSEQSVRAGPQVPGSYTPCNNSFFTSDTDFSYWNNPQHQYDNNCYNFASNLRTDTFAQPGRAAGQMYDELSCRGVGPATGRDGWRRRCQQENNLNIALVIWPSVDFHFYRLCQHGHWCHKPGGTPARNYDDSGQLITDPETCDRGPYTVFCTYFRGWEVFVQ